MNRKGEITTYTLYGYLLQKYPIATASTVLY
jgi:hypothetical protein